MTEKLDGLSMNIEQTERDKLRALFPQCFVEDRLDIDKLLTMCGEYITDDFEKYEFKWKGKSECLQMAQKRSAGTLRPCREESVNFDTTQNLYIEGDNLEVLKLLQTSYYRKVKMIYIDPPYNTGNDFVYEDDFADPMARYKEITAQTTKSNPETMGRFHTNWLNMMYPRLRLAANLLRDDGVIFISIDDNEVHNLRKLCDEVFGEENFRNMIATRRYDKNLNRQFMDDGLASMNTGLEWILAYSKSSEFKMTPVFREANDERASVGYWKGFWNNADRPTMRYDVLGFTPDNGQWKWKKELADEAVENYKEFVNNFSEKMSIEEYWESTGKTKRFLRRNPNGKGMNKGVEHWVAPSSGILRTSNWSDLLASKPSGFDTPFDSPKNVEVLAELVKLSGSDNNDIILDFFSGSATTAHAVMQLNAEDGGNRRFICVQLPEVCDEKSEAFRAGYKNICEIGKERIRRAGAKIVGTQRAVSENDQLQLCETDTARRVPTDVGFRVFKLDSSNLKIWDNTPIPDNDIYELERRLRGMLEIIKDDRTNLDVVYEVMLKLGQDLCEDILELDINGKTAYGVGSDCTFIVCLAEHITPEDAEEMAEYAPGRIIFTDQCFDNTTDKSNVKLTLRDKGIAIKIM